MLDMVNLLELIKKAANEAVENTKPVVVAFGKVVSSFPLKILVEQKLSLDQEQLIVTDHLKNLATGDCVVLLRQQGGQKYIVWDKVIL